jgi:hypothetical protein
VVFLVVVVVVVFVVVVVVYVMWQVDARRLNRMLAGSSLTSSFAIL